MSAFVTEFFLFHNCLVRPVSKMGRKRISHDLTLFENAIAPISQRFGVVGRYFQVLRALKTILLLPPEKITSSSVTGDLIPYYLIIHFLFSNYASEEILSPYKFKDWSISRYSNWVTNKLADHEKVGIIK